MDKAERRYQRCAPVLADIMTTLIENELWLPRREWAQEKRPGANLIINVGSGRKTCVTSYRNKPEMKLTIGVLNVGDKMAPHAAVGWLTSREIIERGYFGGKLGVLELLAQVSLHEFSHVIQSVMAKRRAGKMHDKVFYQILDRAHQGGHAKNMLEAIRSMAKQKGLPINDIENWWRETAEKEQVQTVHREWHVGDGVRVMNREGIELFRGKIVKILRSRVELTDGIRTVRAITRALRPI